MMNPQEKVFEMLNALNIEYQIINHPAVFTVEDMGNLNITQYGDVCKNLFLSDANGKRYFLVVLDKDKKADFEKYSKATGLHKIELCFRRKAS